MAKTTTPRLLVVRFDCCDFAIVAKSFLDVSKINSMMIVSIGIFKK